jgi:hypothetical protein
MLGGRLLLWRHCEHPKSGTDLCPLVTMILLPPDSSSQPMRIHEPGSESHYLKVQMTIPTPEIVGARAPVAASGEDAGLAA